MKTLLNPIPDNGTKFSTCSSYAVISFLQQTFNYVSMQSLQKIAFRFFQCIHIYMCHDVTQAISKKALLIIEGVSFILVITCTKVCRCYHSIGKALSVGLHGHVPTNVFDTVLSYRTNFPSSLSPQVGPCVMLILLKAG